MQLYDGSGATRQVHKLLDHFLPVWFPMSPAIHRLAYRLHALCQNGGLRETGTAGPSFGHATMLQKWPLAKGGHRCTEGERHFHSRPRTSVRFDFTDEVCRQECRISRKRWKGTESSKRLFHGRNGKNGTGNSRSRLIATTRVEAGIFQKAYGSYGISRSKIRHLPHYIPSSLALL